MRHTVTVESHPDSIPMCDLKMGQVGVICPGEDYGGSVVMRVYMGFICLDRPHTTWTDPNPGHPATLVEPLQNGDVVTLIVGGESAS